MAAFHPQLRLVGACKKPKRKSTFQVEFLPFLQLNPPSWVWGRTASASAFVLVLSKAKSQPSLHVIKDVHKSAESMVEIYTKRIDSWKLHLCLFHGAYKKEKIFTKDTFPQKVGQSENRVNCCICDQGENTGNGNHHCMGFCLRPAVLFSRKQRMTEILNPFFAPICSK